MEADRLLIAANAAAVATLMLLCAGACGDSDSDESADEATDASAAMTDDAGVEGDGGQATRLPPPDCYRSGEPFFVPPLVEGERSGGTVAYDLVMQRGTMEFVCDTPTDTFGYSGDFLGPTLRMTKGDELAIDVTNELGEMTTTHWHGFHVPAAMDGGPHQTIAPGETWNARFTMRNRASTYWYHPHFHPHGGLWDPVGTSGQVYRGLAGMIIAEDAESEALALPKTYGVDDLPVIIQDRSFHADGSFNEFPIRREFAMFPDLPDGLTFPARKGDQIVVNGRITPVLETHAQLIRFRIINGSNTRTYNVGFSDGRTFHQIASDGGFLEAPVAMQRLIVSSGERMEILVDFSEDEGKTLRLQSFSSEVADAFVPEPVRDDLDVGDFDLFSITVGAPTDAAVTDMPTSLTTIERIPVSEAINADAPRTFELDMMGTFEPPGPMPERIEQTMMINGQPMDMERIDETVQLGDTEVWEITHASMGWMHPFHIHGDSFQVLSRTDEDGNEIPLPDNEKGWKDVVRVRNGHTVRVIKRFEDFADPVVPYMYHCHLLDHEDAGMMGQFVVVQP